MSGIKQTQRPTVSMLIPYQETDGWSSASELKLNLDNQPTPKIQLPIFKIHESKPYTVCTEKAHESQNPHYIIIKKTFSCQCMSSKSSMTSFPNVSQVNTGQTQMRAALKTPSKCTVIWKRGRHVYLPTLPVFHERTGGVHAPAYQNQSGLEQS